VNAAFLLVTSAMLVGQAGGGAGDKKSEPLPGAPKVVAASSCGPDCGCDGFGHRLRDKLRGAFSRDCDSCKPTACCHEKHARTPLFSCRCEEACKPKLWKWEPTCREHKPHCASTKCSDACDSGCFLDRLRGAFKRDRCCDSCGAAPVKSGEKIDAPKQLPKGGDKKRQEVRIEEQPAPLTPNAIPSVPSVEIVPVPVPAPTAPAPRVDGDRRDPF
jgi:hypothetical protein